MPPITKDTDRVARALVELIDLIDFWRPSGKMYYGSFFRMSILPEYTIERYDPNFSRDIISWVKEYRKIDKEIVRERGSFIRFWPKTYTESEFSVYKIISIICTILLFIVFGRFFLYSLLLILSPYMEPYIDYLVDISPILFVLIFMAFIFSMVYLKAISEKILKGKKYDSDLLGMAQKTIDYTKGYFKNNNIDPRDFPMKMAFNDYQGLTYERKGKRYLAFVKID